MPQITTYPVIAPTADDKLIGTNGDDTATKNFLVGAVGDLAIAGHVAASDPHAQYLTEDNAALLYALLTDPRFTDARTPTGAAGGVLSGTYPNPGFASDMATQAELDAEASTRATADSTNASATATHAARTDNPHSVTAAQVGAYATSAVDVLLALKAPLASPTFSGIPAAPTAANGTNTTQLATTAYVQAALGATNVLAYGAIGDGTTDDTVAIRAAITAAGANGVVLFPPGKTYLISGQPQLLAGQTVLGNGATLKRRNQITTTTTGAITSGVTTSIAVADASNLRVGMNVTFSDSGTAQSALVAGSTLSSVNSQITAIVGNTLTLATAPNASLASGANVYLSFYCLVLANDCKVFGLTFDGNKSNWAWSRWEVENEIFTGTATSRCAIRDCYFLNSPSEGIVVNGSYHGVVNCNLASLNGNGIHFSGATHPLVDGCRVVTCNLNANVGHVMGCIGWSNTIDDATVVNNYLSGGDAGIASIDDVSNSNCTIAHNTIRNCTTYGMYVGGTAANITMEANRVYNCGSGANGGLFVQSSTGRNINIARNTFVSCSVQLSANDMLFADNTLDTASITFNSAINSKVARNFVYGGNIKLTTLTSCDVTGNNVDLVGDTTTTCVVTTGNLSAGCSIRGNRLLGGGKAISIDNNAIDCTIADNDCRGNFAAGIIVQASGAQPGLILQNNSIETSATSASSWIGFRVQSATKVSFLNNVVSNQNGAHANYGVLVSTTGQQVVNGNMIRGTFGVAPISIAAGVTGAYITNNYTEAAIQDLGTSTVLSGNTVIV